MSEGFEFPGFIKLEYAPDGKAEAGFVGAVESIMAKARRSVSDFSKDAQRNLDAALSVKRTSGGSLDLQVPELKAAAAAQQARAIAARELANATLAAAKASGDFNQQTRLEISSAKALAAEEERVAAEKMAHLASTERLQAELLREASATQAVTGAMRAGTTARQSVINSARASRVAYVQLGQQMQDVVIQAQLGTNAFTIFAQQVPQAAFALSGLESSANKTQARIGKLATFMSGPWGAAIFAGTAVLGPLVYSLFQTEDATKKAEFATYSFRDAQSILGSVMDLTTGKINTQSEALLALARAQAVAGQVEARRQQAEARNQFTDIRTYRAEFSGGLGGGISIRRRRSDAADIIEAFQEGSVSLKEAERGLKSLLDTGMLTEQQYLDAATAVTKFGVAAENIKVFEKLDKALGGDKSALSEFLTPGKPKKERKPRDRSQGIERAQEWGRDASNTIAGINQDFNDTPPAIARASSAMAKLADIADDLGRKVKDGMDPAVAKALEVQIRETAGAVETSLTQPFRDYMEDRQRSLTLNSLVLSGREQEAQALSEIYRLQDQIGTEAEIGLKVQDLLLAGKKDEAAMYQRLLAQYPAMKQAILENVEAEKAMNDQLAARQDMIDAYIGSLRGIRGDMEALLGGSLSGKGFLKSLKANFAQLQGRLLFEQLFGAQFRKIEDQIKASTGIQSSVDIMKEGTEKAGKSAGSMADSLESAASRVDKLFHEGGHGGGSLTGSLLGGSGTAANDNGFTADFLREFDAAFGGGANKPGSLLNAGDEANIAKTIADNTGQLRRSAMGLSPDSFFNRIGKGIASPLEGILGTVFGAKFGDTISGAIGGAVGGYASGGVFGALAGGLSSLFPKGMQDQMAAGVAAGQLGGALGGLIGSNKYASMGGQAGAFAFGPLGGILGGLAGGLLGSVFKKTKKGKATISGGNTIISGNSGKREEAAGGAADSVTQGLESIADALGADLDWSKGKVTIAVRKKDWRVDPTGGGNTKTSKGAIDFGSDQEAAIKYAIADLIKDGVLSGLREGTMRLIKAKGDLEDQIAKAVDFEGVFKELKRIKDPVGAALDDLDKEFTRLKNIFDEAGASAAEYADLEELYGIKRAEAIKQANEQILGSLQDLYDELTIGDSGLSLRDRKANAQAKYDPLAERVAAGDTTAYDDFAQAARDLLDIERQMSGSQTDYFDLLKEVTDLTKTRLDASTALSDAAAGRDPLDLSKPAANDNAAINDSINRLGLDYLAGMGIGITAVNANLGTIIRAMQAGGTLAAGSAAPSFMSAGSW